MNAKEKMIKYGAGKVLGIKVVDHVIVSDTAYKSLCFSEMYDLNF